MPVLWWHLAAFDWTITSISLIGSARAAFGVRTADAFFVGPETHAIWCIDYTQLRFGAQVTGLKLGNVQWSAATGWAIESFGRSGPYLRLGFNTRL